MCSVSLDGIIQYFTHNEVDSLRYGLVAEQSKNPAQWVTLPETIDRIFGQVIEADQSDKNGKQQLLLRINQWTYGHPPVPNKKFPLVNTNMVSLSYYVEVFALHDSLWTPVGLKLQREELPRTTDERSLQTCTEKALLDIVRWMSAIQKGDSIPPHPRKGISLTQRDALPPPYTLADMGIDMTTRGLQNGAFDSLEDLLLGKTSERRAPQIKRERNDGFVSVIPTFEQMTAPHIAFTDSDRLLYLQNNGYLELRGLGSVEPYVLRPHDFGDPFGTRPFIPLLAELMAYGFDAADGRLLDSTIYMPIDLIPSSLNKRNMSDSTLGRQNMGLRIVISEYSKSDSIIIRIAGQEYVLQRREYFYLPFKDLPLSMSEVAITDATNHTHTSFFVDKLDISSCYRLVEARKSKIITTEITRYDFYKRAEKGEDKSVDKE